MNNTSQLEHRRRSRLPVAVVVAIIGAIGLGLGSILPEIWKHFFPPVPQQSTTLPSPQDISSPNSQSTGSTHLPDGTLMCWGQAELTEGAGSDSRAFAFEFKEPFAAAPTVTTGIDCKSAGYEFAVYNHQLTEKSYSGRVADVNFRKNSAPVTMHYLAVGTPKVPFK